MNADDRQLLPADHPQRVELNDEVHARPPGLLATPLRVSYIALRVPPSTRDDEIGLLRELAGMYSSEGPVAGSSHFSADLGPFRIRWEHHTEFARYMLIADGAEKTLFGEPAILRAPGDWIAGLPGQTVVATHVSMLPAPAAEPDYDEIANRDFAGNPLMGAAVAGGAGIALTDLRIHPDGFGRMLVLDRGMTSRQAGRIVQRLLEIDTYRMMALMALPVARELSPFLYKSEAELAEITSALTSAEAEDESKLLDRLTRLQAALENRAADNNYRFGAATAYYDLVQRRIRELREERLQGLQTFREFTERRLAPAMNTCEAVSRRQESLSKRMARATRLLSTRVDIERTEQNQALLASMNRRAAMQIRLQTTVEGFSVAAITYYLVGLINYLAKSAEAMGFAVNASLVTAASIPLVAVGVALGIKSVRRMVSKSPASRVSGAGPD
jgi:uncharacterized membrane-anchored protein